MASAPLALFASTAGCELHPVVVFAVLDHHKRREQGASSVVGALLGTRSGKTVVISDAFAVPTGENGAYDMAYHRTMVQLHERVNPKERVVGWYTTATEVVPAMAGTHGQLSREHQANLVLLTVDASFAGKRLDIKAFDASEFVSKERALLARFAELPVTLTASAPEKLAGAFLSVPSRRAAPRLPALTAPPSRAVDSLINSNPEDDKLDAPATILSELDSLEQSMQALLHSIETVQRYVSKVQVRTSRADSAALGARVRLLTRVRARASRRARFKATRTWRAPSRTRLRPSLTSSPRPLRRPLPATCRTCS